VQTLLQDDLHIDYDLVNAPSWATMTPLMPSER